MRAWLAGMLLSIVVPCAHLPDVEARREDAAQASQAIAAELGLGSTLDSMPVTTPHGERFVVLVQLQSGTSGDTAAIDARVRDIVRKRYRVAVDEVRISR